jgi:glycogen(starch) synthase
VKILYWADAFWPTIGGIEVFSTHLISALKKRGYEFIVVTDHRNHNIADETEYNGIPVYRYHFQRQLVSQDIGQIRTTIEGVAKLKKTVKPALIHINACGPSLFYHLCTVAAYSAPSLVTIHALLTRSGGGDTILGKVLRKADWVSTVSEAMLEEVREILPEITSRSSVIHNSLDSLNLQPTPLPTDVPRLLCVGRLVVDKGFDLALTAFASLTQRFPNLRLIIAGNGPAMSDLRKYTLELGITDSVEFTGWVDPEEISKLMNTATLVIVPSRWAESFGLVALQAAQMARPVVATRVGGLPEIVDHGKTGLIVEKENIQALCEAITFLLQNPECAIRMGQSARSRAENLFNWKRFVDTYDARYRQIIERDPLCRSISIA